MPSPLTSIGLDEMVPPAASRLDALSGGGAGLRRGSYFCASSSQGGHEPVSTAQYHCPAQVLHSR